MSRYDGRFSIANDLLQYRKLFDSRNVKFIIHHRTQNNLNLPDSFLKNILVQQEVWKEETKLHKLSNKYYKTTEYWWVIGLINKKPTDAEWKIGDIINVPLDLPPILEYLVINSNNGGV